MLIPEYESVAIMDSRWTRMKEVKDGLERAGFRDIDARDESELWGWHSASFLDGGIRGMSL